MCSPYAIAVCSFAASGVAGRGAVGGQMACFEWWAGLRVTYAVALVLYACSGCSGCREAVLTDRVLFTTGNVYHKCLPGVQSWRPVVAWWRSLVALTCGVPCGVPCGVVCGAACGAARLRPAWPGHVSRDAIQCPLCAYRTVPHRRIARHALRPRRPLLICALLGD